MLPWPRVGGALSGALEGRLPGPTRVSNCAFGVADIRLSHPAIRPDWLSAAWVGALTGFILLERFGRVGMFVARLGRIAMLAAGILLMVARPSG
jgi:hypothetical protein